MELSIDREKVIENLKKAKMIIEKWVPMFEQYNTPFGIDVAIDLLKKQDEEIENLKQTAQSMMEGICLLKEQENEDECCPICGIRRKYGNS